MLHQNYITLAVCFFKYKYIHGNNSSIKFIYWRHFVTLAGARNDIADAVIRSTATDIPHSNSFIIAVLIHVRAILISCIGLIRTPVPRCCLCKVEAVVFVSVQEPPYVVPTSVTQTYIQMTVTCVGCIYDEASQLTVQKIFLLSSSY